MRMVLGGQTPQTAARSCCFFARLKTLWPHAIYVTLDLPKSVSRVTSQKEMHERGADVARAVGE